MRIVLVFTLWLAVGLPEAEAITIIVDTPSTQVRIRVGSPGNTINQVVFTVPFANIGTGTPVAGDQTIEIELRARASPADSRQVTLTADSSAPLTNGAASLSFTSISWTASDPDIPSGTFNGGVQTLMSFFNSRQVSNTHSFSYNNTQVLEAGAYSGRVTYTLTMP